MLTTKSIALMLLLQGVAK